MCSCCGSCPQPSSRNRTTAFCRARSSRIRASPFKRWNRSWRNCRPSRSRIRRLPRWPDSRAGAHNQANVFIELKPLSQRKLSASQVVARLRPRLNAVSGARLFLQAAQDLRIGGRQSAAEYQYTLTSDDPNALFKWVPKLVTALSKDRADVADA